MNKIQVTVIPFLFTKEKMKLLKDKGIIWLEDYLASTLRIPKVDVRGRLRYVGRIDEIEKEGEYYLLKLDDEFFLIIIRPC